MKNLGFKKMIIPTVYLVSVLSVIGCIFLTISSINKYLTEQKDFNYSTNAIIEESIKPVQGTENTLSQIIKPYNSDKVSVGRYFYDFEDEAKNQENAIIFYENTYMQNTGVDYISETTFDVLSVLPGKIINIEKDDVLGNILKIEHDKDIITVYQGIDKINHKVGDKVTQGTIIGTSGTSLVNSNFATSLHFEVYYKGSLVDPETFYSLKLEDL